MQSTDENSNAVHGLVPGQVLANRYLVERWLDIGGSAVVYAATDLTNSRPVALKLLLGHQSSPQAVARFHQELEHARVLDHINILPILGTGTDGTRHFLVSELLQGMDLRRLLQTQPPTLAESLRWLTHATCALEHAHERGVLHRDVKPGNLFITQGGLLKLMDFGFAKSRHVPSTTAHGAVFGTPEYISPEQVMGTPVTAATDLYSLGVVAYELLTGQRPFYHSEPMPLMFMHVQHVPVPPRALNPRIPEPLERVVLKLLAKPPGCRYPNAAALRVALRELWPLLLPGGPKPQPTPPRREPPSR